MMEFGCVCWTFGFCSSEFLVVNVFFFPKPSASPSPGLRWAQTSHTWDERGRERPGFLGGRGGTPTASCVQNQRLNLAVVPLPRLLSPSCLVRTLRGRGRRREERTSVSAARGDISHSFLPVLYRPRLTFSFWRLTPAKFLPGDQKRRRWNIYSFVTKFSRQQKAA